MLLPHYNSMEKEYANSTTKGFACNDVTPVSRKERRKQRKQLEGGHAHHDAVSAWEECQTNNVTWGGRGKGGRGAYEGNVNSIHSNVHLSNFTVSLPSGKELVSGATMDLRKGRRYGLVGRNGVGKSTLLRRLATHAIPGMPHNMRVLLVDQQQETYNDGATTLEALIEADIDLVKLQEEQDTLEDELESYSGEILQDAVERLGELSLHLEAAGADTAESRATEILKGLQFKESMIESPAENLSGGWRMRLALARALFCQNTDLLLLDECTNHLDLNGLEWLSRYLNQIDTTVVIVSHDVSFLDKICTDICVLANSSIRCQVGDYSAYRRQQQEKAAREAQIIDSSERQRAKALDFVQKQHQQSKKKGLDPKKQQQAKMIKDKKIDRIGKYREDGKRFKEFSLKTLDERSLRLAQKVHIEVEEPVSKMLFPPPVWHSSVTQNDTIVQLENVGFVYNDDKYVFQNISVRLNRGSKVALVGANGVGKTTLVKAIIGELDRKNVSGNLWIQSHLRFGHVSQYSVEELGSYSETTVLDYAQEKLKSGRVAATVTAGASGNMRQYLGAFGLGGKLAQSKIGSLSGGERMRLCFASVMADEPHLLILDESTNHVDIETLEVMSHALNEFDGSVLMVSHNQAFLSGFCNELWVLEKGRLVSHFGDEQAPGTSFDEMFSKYRRGVLQNTSTLSKNRVQLAKLARRATKQRRGATQNTALL